VVPDKALLRLAAQRPDFVLELGLRMSQGLKQQLGQLEAIQQVGACETLGLQLYQRDVEARVVCDVNMHTGQGMCPGSAEWTCGHSQSKGCLHQPWQFSCAAVRTDGGLHGSDVHAQCVFFRSRCMCAGDRMVQYTNPFTSLVVLGRTAAVHHALLPPDITCRRLILPHRVRSGVRVPCSRT
jgi:hypothetical protein